MKRKTLWLTLGLVAMTGLLACSDGPLSAIDETTFLKGSSEGISGTLTTTFPEKTGFKPTVYPLQMESNLELQSGDGFKLDATISSSETASSISFNGQELKSDQAGLSTTLQVMASEQDLLSTMKERTEELRARVEKMQPVSSQEWKKKLISSKGAQVKELPDGNLELSRSFLNKDGKTVVTNLVLDSQKRMPISMNTYLDGKLVSTSSIDAQDGQIHHSYHYDGQDSKRPIEPSPWK